MVLVALVAVAGLLIQLSVGLSAAVTARHRADAAADLAALAAVDSGEGCPAADRIARANGAQMRSCTPGADGSVTVIVTVQASALGRTAQATARAGPGAFEPTVSDPAGHGSGPGHPPNRGATTHVHQIGDTEWVVRAVGVTFR